MKANQTAPDMFAILEHEQRIAHFPAPTDYAACAAFYGTIIDQYDAAHDDRRHRRRPLPPKTSASYSATTSMKPARRRPAFAAPM